MSPKPSHIHPQLLPLQGVSSSPGEAKALGAPFFPPDTSDSTAHHRDNGCEGLLVQIDQV